MVYTERIIVIDREYEPPEYKKPKKRKGTWYTLGRGRAKTRWLRRQKNEQN